jgi:hypothetical protein
MKLPITSCFASVLKPLMLREIMVISSILSVSSRSLFLWWWYAPPVVRYCSLPLPAIFRCRFSSLSFPTSLTWSRWVEVTLCEELVEGLAEFIYGGDRIAVADCLFSSLEEFAFWGDRVSEVAEFFPSSFLFKQYQLNHATSHQVAV